MLQGLLLQDGKGVCETLIEIYNYVVRAPAKEQTASSLWLLVQRCRRC